MRFQLSGAAVLPRAFPLTTADLEHLAVFFDAVISKGRKKSVTVTFLTSPEMQKLNRERRGLDKPTDVISFAAAEGERFPNEDTEHAGDLFLCLPYIRASAEKQSINFTEETARMFVHGAMHTLGYDHMELDDETRMFKLQERILKDFFAGKK